MEKITLIDKGPDGEWEVTSTIEDPNPASFDSFGYSIDVEGDRMMVGARSDDEFDSSGGAVHYYEFDNGQWNPVQKIASPNSSDSFWFGSEVDFSGNWLAVRSSTNFISLYQWNESNRLWELAQRLTSSGSSDSVSLEGTQLLRGDAEYGNGNAFATGQGILYYLSSEGVWERVARLQADSSQSWRRLGGKVLIGDQEYLLGSGLRARGISGDSATGCVLCFGLVGGESYEEWSLRLFDSVQRSENLHLQMAVPNNLGLRNLASYPMGLNPFDPDAGRMPKVVVENDGLNYFSYQLSKNAVEVDVSPLQSTDLTTWSPLDEMPDQVHSRELDHYRIPLSGLKRFYKIEFLDRSE